MIQALPRFGSHTFTLRAGEHRYHLAQTEAESQADTKTTLSLSFTLHSQAKLWLSGICWHTKNHSTVHISIEHQTPDSHALVDIRSLVAGAVCPLVDGKLYITETAPHSSSFFSHSSLLLHPQASIQSVPSLDIRTNQVQCSHKATIRSLNKSDTFYLQTRGIDAAHARQLCIQAFCQFPATFTLPPDFSSNEKDGK
jgi:Fe-S cluster assembly scaffold protein SufB